MENPIELFKKISVVQPGPHLYNSTLDKIQAYEKNKLSRLQLFAIAASITLLIGSCFYASLQDRKFTNEIESSEFIHQTDLYE